LGRTKVNKNFYEDELIPPEIYRNKRVLNEWFIDPLMLKVVQDVRDYYGPVTINNWLKGGPFKYSGYRHPNCPEGAKLSMHRFMKAMDLKPSECEAKDIIDDIINFNKLIKNGNPQKAKIPWFAYRITCVEYSINGRRLNWAHIGIRPTRKKHGLLIIKIKTKGSK